MWEVTVVTAAAIQAGFRPLCYQFSIRNNFRLLGWHGGQLNDRTSHTGGVGPGALHFVRR